MNKWFISDLHLGHALMITVGRPFATVQEMDAALLHNWNAVVQDEDQVFILGDISVGTRENKREVILRFLQRARGHKTWILGNHDPSPDVDFIKNTTRIQGAYVLGNEGWVLTHIPIHPECLEHRWAANIHGHTHTKDISDPRYFNVSVERIGYTPIHINTIKQKLKERT